MTQRRNKQCSNPPGGLHSRYVGEKKNQFESKTSYCESEGASHGTQQTLRKSCESGRSWEDEYEELENAIRVRHYSKKTLRSYRKYVRDFQVYTQSLQPQLLNAEHVKNYLTFLAVEKNVSASTQNLAFNSLLFSIVMY